MMYRYKTFVRVDATHVPIKWSWFSRFYTGTPSNANIIKQKTTLRKKIAKFFIYLNDNAWVHHRQATKK